MAKREKTPLVDHSTIAFAVAALLGACLTAWLRGLQGIEHAIMSAGGFLLHVLPQVFGGLLIAGLVQVLVPRETVSRWLGAESGMRGIFIAQAAGMLTPGGPFGSFALVYALGKAGADIGVLITYLTAWTTISLLRLVVWEIPFLGIKFALLRFTICLPICVLAGVLSRRWARRWGWTTTEAIVK